MNLRPLKFARRFRQGSPLFMAGALLFAASQAQAQLWDTYKGVGFTTAEKSDWWLSYGPFSDFEELRQAAYDFCKTTSAYQNPAIDCTGPHPNNPDKVSFYGPTGYPEQDRYVAEVWMYNRNGLWGRLDAWWYPYHTADTDCPTGQVIGHKQYDCVDEEYYAAAPILTDQDSCSKNNESNPCNPANGNKSQIETDFVGTGDGALRFDRYYNSSGAYRSSQDWAVAGWRHTYSRRLDEPPDTVPDVTFAAPVNQSDSYTTASAACTSGWDEIKNELWSGDLSSGTATFAGGNTCKIAVSGSTVAYLPVRASHGWYNRYSHPTGFKFVTRPNGARIVFEQDGSNWVNELNSSVSLIQSGSNWIFTDEDDTKETYNSAGKLVSIAYRNGQTETLTYTLSVNQGGDNRPETLDRVTGPFGYKINLSYVSGRLSWITTPEGIVEYDYDSYDNLISATYPDSTVRQYLYEDGDLPNHLTGIIDENNDRFATWEYDDAGRAVLSEHAGGKEQVEFVYNTNGTTRMTIMTICSRRRPRTAPRPPTSTTIWTT